MAANISAALSSLPSPTALLASLPPSLQSSFGTFLAATHDAPWKSYIVPGTLGYLLLVRALRYRREKSMLKRYGFQTRESLAKMTVLDAHHIIKELATLEFPSFLVTALQFGLFKTYGVESISRLLLATRNLTDPVASLKRYEDTAVIIGEFTANPPDSARANASIARMNWLHSKYVASGQISNADLLYTLSVFVVEPERFMRLYEWRPLNEMERCAYGVFWKSIGDAMGIKYEGYLSKTHWKDGLDWADDVAQWAKAYEIVSFKPSVVSNKPARTLIPMITYWVPKPLKAFVNECVVVLLGDRVREAFMLPEPGIGAAATVYVALNVRKLFLRHLALPRFIPINRHSEDDDSLEKRHHINWPYGNYPFYIKPTFWNRWGPQAWAVWLIGGTLPGDNGDEYLPQGFKFDDLGPRSRMNQGHQEMEKDYQRLRSLGRGGCPFG
ncbi:hypothetical protein BX600DRAFT_485795 [Xylariales sp. PMI_506]|nr:hypothetical protein BX600DRAFT_485795 [Xylariales sp. PMI_506]